MTAAKVMTWVVKPLLFAVSLVPFAMLVFGLFNDTLGANPVETITHQTGEWGLRFLLFTLAITPIRHLTGWQAIVRVRRMLGLFCFFYVLLHFTTYVWLDHEFSVADIVEDIVERSYVTAGFTALLILIPLAATSTNGMVKRLGGGNWRRLHRLVYVALAAALLHFIWLVKADLTEPLIYTGIGVALMAFRLPRVQSWLNNRRRRQQPGHASTT